MNSKQKNTRFTLILLFLISLNVILVMTNAKNLTASFMCDNWNGEPCLPDECFDTFWHQCANRCESRKCDWWDLEWAKCSECLCYSRFIGECDEDPGYYVIDNCAEFEPFCQGIMI